MSTILSAPSTPVAAVIAPTRGCLSDPLDPSTALLLRRLATIGTTMVNISAQISWSDSDSEEQGVFYAFDRPNAIVQHGTIHPGGFVLSFLLDGRQERDILAQLRASQHTLLVRTDMGEAFYVALGATLPRSVLRDVARVAHPYTVVSVQCTIVDPP